MKFLTFFLILVLPLSACSKKTDSYIHAYVNLTPSPTVFQASPTPTATPIPTPSPLSVSISIGGDVMFDSYVSETINKIGLDNYIEDIAPIFKCSDISMVNLETAISTRGEKEKDKQFTFRADSKYLQVLASSGINVVTLANNHSLDFGATALEDTFSYLTEKNIAFVGAGRDMDEASKAIHINKNNVKITILGSSHVIPFVSWNAGSKSTGLATTYDPTRLNSEIRKAKSISDFVICYIHWGEEGKNLPVEYQKVLAHSYIDNGADLVVGSHPHVLQGIEYYKNKTILYSMGNLIFTDMYKKTAIAKITINNTKSVSLKILPVDIVNFKPTLVNDYEKSHMLFKELESISFGVKIDTSGNVLPKY